MVAHLIYLAGPIAGQSYEDARNGWRKAFAEMMPGSIECISPMRGKDHLEGHYSLSGEASAYADNVMSSQKGITSRDRFDCRRADLIVAYFLDAPLRPSLGTAIEFGWADAWRVPIVMVSQPGNVHNHPMLAEIAGFHVETLAEAAALARKILMPGV